MERRGRDEPAAVDPTRTGARAAPAGGPVHPTPLDHRRFQLPACRAAWERYVVLALQRWRRRPGGVRRTDAPTWTRRFVGAFGGTSGGSGRLGSTASTNCLDKVSLGATRPTPRGHRPGSGDVQPPRLAVQHPLGNPGPRRWDSSGHVGELTAPPVVASTPKCPVPAVPPG